MKPYIDTLPKGLINPIWAIVVAIAYYLSAKFGLGLSFKPDYIAALWPPNAILLSALLLSKPRQWPWFLSASIPAELAADLPSGIPLIMSLGFVAADWIEVLTAAMLLRRFSATAPDFISLRQTATYILCCAIIAPLFAAFPGAFVSGINYIGHGYPMRWFQWFAGDTLTHLTITPFILLVLRWKLDAIRSHPLSYYIELLVLVVSLILVNLLALSGLILDTQDFPAIICAPLPLLLWGSVRFGVRGIFSLAVFVTIFTVNSSANGYGPFYGHSLVANVINLQLFLIVTLTPFILLAALIEDHKRMTRQIAERESQYRALFDNNISVILIIDPETGDIIDANPSACTYYGYSKKKLTQMKITDINTMTKEEVHEEMKKAKLHKRKYFNFMHRLSDGSIRDVEVFSGPILVSGSSLLCSIVHDISERKETEREKEQVIGDLKKALSEVKTLRGFIPICASCKKIRDDKGFWKQIEAYISDHSEAEFSHSICPECRKKYYPELEIY